MFMRILYILSLLLAGACSTTPNTSFKSSSITFLEQYQNACKSGKEIWNKNMCVPMIVVDRNSLEAVATKQTPTKDLKKINSMYSGKYSGPQLYANTSIQWNNQRWSMVLWPLPNSKSDRIELLMHEAWHSIQNDLGLPAYNAFLTHIDEYNGRLLIRLEWAALLEALKDNTDSQQHLKNALKFRELRFKKYSYAQNTEKTLDFNEGLAAYTGIKFRSNNNSAILQHLEDKLNKVEEVTSLTRSASYYTGPLYGLLLDKSGEKWKLNLNSSKGFGDLLTKAYKLEKSSSSDMPPTSTLASYGFQEIDTYEQKRDKVKKEKINSYLNKISQKSGLSLLPSLGAPQMFDPRTILVVGQNDLIYVNYETNSDWGNLKVSGGVRVKDINGRKTLLLSPPTQINGNALQGDGWSLTLKRGWKLTTNKNSRSTLERKSL